MAGKVANMFLTCSSYVLQNLRPSSVNIQPFFWQIKMLDNEKSCVHTPMIVVEVVLSWNSTWANDDKLRISPIHISLILRV